MLSTNKKRQEKTRKIHMFRLRMACNYNLSTFCLFFLSFLSRRTDRNEKKKKERTISTPQKNLCFHEEERLMQRGRTRRNPALILSKRTQIKKKGRERRKEESKCKARERISPEKMCTYQLLVWDLSEEMFNPKDSMRSFEGKSEKFER